MWRTLSTVLGGRPHLHAQLSRDPASSALVADADPVPSPAHAPVPTPAPDLHPAPDLLGASAHDARRIARAAGLHVDVEERATSRGSWGRVVAQVPEPGSELVDGEPMLVVVGARPDVIVPDVRGRDEEDALRALADAGLGIARRVMRRSDAVPEGHIVRTRPRAGAEVPAGSRVSYVVGVGPKESAGHRHGDRHRARARRLPDGTFISLPE